jgi:hypothetical protein
VSASESADAPIRIMAITNNESCAETWNVLLITHHEYKNRSIDAIQRSPYAKIYVGDSIPSKRYTTRSGRCLVA